MILSDPQIKARLNGSTLFLDTNVFSCASKHRDFFGFLLDLKENGCALATIPSVVFEVTRGSQTIQMFNERRDLVTEIAHQIVPIDRFLDKLDDFNVIMAKIQNPKDSQYTDHLLAACLAHFRHTKTYLMTTDLKSMPKDIFSRDFVITVESEKGITNFAIFSLDQQKYGAVVRRLISSA